MHIFIKVLKIIAVNIFVRLRRLYMVKALFAKVQDYINEHRKDGIHINSYDTVISFMFSDGKLTKEEYDNLKNNSVFTASSYSISANNTDSNMYSDMGLSLGNIQNTFVNNTRQPYLNENTIANIEKRANRVLDLYNKMPFKVQDLAKSESKLDFLKQYYPEDKYTIEEGQTPFGSVRYDISDKDGNYAASVYADGNDYVSMVTDDITATYCYGKISANAYIDKNTCNIYLDGKGSINEVFESKQSNQIVTLRYHNNKIDYAKLTDLDADKTIEAYHYTKDTTEALKKAVIPKADYDKLNKILDDISPENIYIVLSDFNKETGIYLDDLCIDNDIVSNKFKKITESWMIDKDEAAEYYGTKMYKMLNESNDAYDLYRVIRRVKSNHIPKMLETFTKLKKENTKEDIEVPYRPDTIYVLDAIQEKYGEGSELVCEELLERISEHTSWNLNDKNNDIIIAQAETILKYKASSGAYINDIIKDFNSSDSNVKKVVDITRAINRGVPRENSKATEFNGKIDEDFSQGRTGDCWLLAGVISLCQKENGKKYLESLLDYSTPGHVTVNLKGVGVKYTISKKEIDEMKHLASGDGDVRAIEFAVDKYMKEYAYKNATKDAIVRPDINGNNETYLFELLIEGYNKNKEEIPEIPYRSQNDVLSDAYDQARFEDLLAQVELKLNKIISNINNPNVSTTTAFTPFIDWEKLVDLAIDVETGEKVTLYQQHAYAIQKCDGKDIYLINPWDSSKTIKMPLDKFKQVCFCMSQVEIPEVKEEGSYKYKGIKFPKYN